MRPKSKTYGVSYDPSVKLKELPTNYPKVGEAFKDGLGLHYTVVAIDKGSDIITITNTDTEIPCTIHLDIESFESTYTPIDNEYNYPL